MGVVLSVNNKKKFVKFVQFYNCFLNVSKQLFVLFLEVHVHMYYLDRTFFPMYSYVCLLMHATYLTLSFLAL